MSLTSRLDILQAIRLERNQDGSRSIAFKILHIDFDVSPVETPIYISPRMPGFGTTWEGAVDGLGLSEARCL